MFGLNTIRNWYGRFERPISSLSLIGGFVFDAVYLKRVDLFWENFWIIIHLLIVASCIIWINRVEHEVEDESNPAKLHFWLLNVLQFFFGGLLSAFLVFYFRSATLSASWPFLLILVVAFISNEKLKKHYSRLSFQIILLYLSIFCFLIFFTPLLVHAISSGVFILSGLFSLGVIWLFIYFLAIFTKDKLHGHKTELTLFIGIIFILMNVLYFTNIIPPLPLSLKDSGIYYSVSRDSAGNYSVGEEEIGWSKYFNLYPDFHLVPGDTIYAFSAVFSPESFNTGVIHEWQYFDKSTNDWITESRISLPVVGGRDGGYRTYSTRTNPAPGHWRVNVLTNSGLVLGRLKFNIVPTTIEPILRQIVQ